MGTSQAVLGVAGDAGGSEGCRTMGAGTCEGIEVVVDAGRATGALREGSA